MIIDENVEEKKDVDLEKMEKSEEDENKQDEQEIAGENGDTVIEQEPHREDEKYQREGFLHSVFLLVGLAIAAVVSGLIISRGPDKKEVLFHSLYIAGFILYALFFFATRKKRLKKYVIRQRVKRILFDAADCLYTVLIAFVLAVFVLDCFKISVVDGQSMDNTLHNGQKLLLGMHAYDFEDMQRGDIVVCDAPQLNEYIIKRIIGLPGDHLQILDNTVYINGNAITENYIKEPMVTEDLDITVPKGKLFVMGDNRNNSGDSRWDAVGYIDIEDELQGKIVFGSLFGIE